MQSRLIIPAVLIGIGIVSFSAASEAQLIAKGGSTLPDSARAPMRYFAKKYLKKVTSISFKRRQSAGLKTGDTPWKRGEQAYVGRVYGYDNNGRRSIAMVTGVGASPFRTAGAVDASKGSVIKRRVRGIKGVPMSNLVARLTVRNAEGVISGNNCTITPSRVNPDGSRTVYVNRTSKRGQATVLAYPKLFGDPTEIKVSFRR